MVAISPFICNTQNANATQNLCSRTTRKLQQKSLKWVHYHELVATKKNNIATQ